MIDKNSAMAILQALPQDKVLQALQMVGAGMQPGGAGLDGLAMSPGAGSAMNKITPWSGKDVPYGGGKDRPALIDKMWAKPAMNAQVPVQGGALMADEDPYLQTGGM